MNEFKTSGGEEAEVEESDEEEAEVEESGEEEAEVEESGEEEAEVEESGEEEAEVEESDEEGAGVEESDEEEAEVEESGEEDAEVEESGEEEQRPIPRHSRHVLNEVAEEHDLDPDVLLIHAIDFDFDNNGYLNRKELKAAAEDLAAEKPEEEHKACPICDAHNDISAKECNDCGHFFTD